MNVFAFARFKRATLVQRLFRLTAIPAIAGAVVLGSYLTQRQVGEIENLLNANAQSIAAQTAMLAAEPLARANRPELNRIATSLIQLPNVRRARMIGEDGEVLAAVGDLSAASDDTMIIVSHDARAGQPLPGQSRTDAGTVQIGMSTGPLTIARRQQRIAATLALLLTLVVCSLMSWWVARSIGGPIRRLADAMERLGLGDLNLRVPVTERGEIGTLQSGFNSTAASLANAQQSMQAEISRATTELAVKNGELESANLSKSRFLAAASHDLRQPLHALTLFSAGLQDGEENPARRERIGRIQECVSSLDRLFTELLDLSRLDSGSIVATPANFPIDTLFSEISQTFRPIAEDRELRLVLRKTDLWVRTDRAMLSQLLNNLVSNAIKYTREGGVLVGARRRGSFVRIDVWDTGLGIPEEFRTKVFDEFFQIGTDTARAQRGLGLGLSTVKRLAELMRAPMSLRSIPGRGSVFSFQVPLAQTVTRVEPARPAPATVDLAGLRVMVIDDERAILEGIEWLMKSWRCEVVCVETLEEAQVALAKMAAPPHLLISDLRLREGSNGIDVIRILRQEVLAVDGSEPAALLVTGETAADRLREIAAAGLPMLHKPVQPERLREAIATVVAGRHASVAA